MGFLQTFVDLLFRIFEFAIFIRIILSWINPLPQYGNPVFRLVWQITEPILAPIRRFATFGMIDFSPFVALIGMQIVQGFLLQMIAGMR